jgi:hypothetical protein
LGWDAEDGLKLDRSDGFQCISSVEILLCPKEDNQSLAYKRSIGLDLEKAV